MIRGLETKPYEERLKELGMSYRGRAAYVYDHPKVQEMQQWTEVTRSQILVEYQETFLTVRAVWQWNQLPQEVMSAPTLEAFKRNLVKVLADIP